MFSFAFAVFDDDDVLRGKSLMTICERLSNEPLVVVQVLSILLNGFCGTTVVTDRDNCPF